MGACWQLALQLLEQMEGAVWDLKHVSMSGPLKGGLERCHIYGAALISPAPLPPPNG